MTEAEIDWRIQIRSQTAYSRKQRFSVQWRHGTRSILQLGDFHMKLYKMCHERPIAAGTCIHSIRGGLKCLVRITTGTDPTLSSRPSRVCAAQRITGISGLISVIPIERLTVHQCVRRLPQSRSQLWVSLRLSPIERAHVRE